MQFSLTFSKVISLVVILVVLFAGVSVFAQGSTGNTNPSGTTGNTGVIQNPLKGANNFYELANRIISSIVIPIGSVVIVIMIIYSGFLFVTAQGNETKIGDAKKTLTYAVIGAAILLGALAITEIIKTTVNQVVGENVISG